MKHIRVLLLIVALLALSVMPVFAQKPADLKVIEVRDGRLLEGVSGEDITGPIVLMEDGKLPGWVSEEYLAQIGATVLSVRSGDKLPFIIPESIKEHHLAIGITEEKLEEMGYIVVKDAVIEAGKALIQELDGQQSKNAIQQVPGEHISWTNVYEAWPPGSNIVQSSATQWSSLYGSLRNVAVTYDVTWGFPVWGDDKSTLGYELGIGGSANGIDGHYYVLDAYYYYQGVLWDIGTDAMQL